MALFVVDTSVLLSGYEPPPGRWWTTAQADAEVSPGGRDARRYEDWKSKGLEIHAPASDAAARVRSAAQAAGNLPRLSPADLSLLALALEASATLVTEDKTMLDVALRLKVATFSRGGIEATLDFRPRCVGCGRWFEVMPKAAECTVCGSEVKPKPWASKEKR